MLLAYAEGGFTKVLPVRESDHEQAVELVVFLQNEWLKIESEESDRTRMITDRYWDIIKAICLMVPTVPGLEWHFDKLKTNPDLIKFFFLHPEGSFWKLHEFELKGDVEPRPNCLEDENADLIAENLPFPSSGNPKADKIASYIHGTEWGPTQIKALFEWCSREEIAGIQYTIGELANPDRRLDKEKKRIAEDIYSSLDPALYDSTHPDFKWDTEGEIS
jgi:hypothetical protein